MSLPTTLRSAFDWPLTTSRFPFTWPSVIDELNGDLAVRVEEFEEEGHFVIRAEVPGVNPDQDIDISVSGTMLRLSIHREKRSESSTMRHYRSEFHYGSFIRTIDLPTMAADEDIDATYEDGVLEIRIKLNGKSQSHQRIAIKHS